MKRLIILAVLFFVGGLIIYIFDPFIEQVQSYPSGINSYSIKGAYRINAATLLQALAHGETDVFSPEVPIPDGYTRLTQQNSTLDWREADYLKVADAVFLYTWGEDVSAWDLESLILQRTCNDELDSFGIGRLTYFKSKWANGRIVYTAREIDIYPIDEMVYWGGGANFPHPIFGWKSIKARGERIDAETALRIAEENGGMTARQSVQDRCQITQRLSGKDEWKIWYYNENGNTIYEVQISQKTGQVIDQP